MTSVVLTIIDTAGIQDYIFGSNRLRENIGASYLVEQATHAWVYQCLPEPHNVQDVAIGALDTSKHIQQNELAAELIYAGGGNTAILFCSLPVAQRFARDVSRRILEAAPGLEIVIVHSAPFEWLPTANNLKDEVQKLRDERLAAKKRTRQATPTPLLGLGVTAACSSTGLVATQSNRGLEPATVTPRLVSRNIVAKLQAVSSATQRLRQVVERHDTDAQLTDMTFSDELDHLGRTGGQESYIGVVHIDGNDMGKLIQERAAGARDNFDYIERQRKFSSGVEAASEKALVATLRQLHGQFFFSKEDGWHVREVLPQVAPPDYRVPQSRQKISLFWDEKEEKPCWPVRPLVFGGDDVTFVCNGQLGLSLATAYMRTFTEHTKHLLGIPIHTGAGICVVKVHYPFRRAYAVSERLTSSAKSILGHERAQASALDWHFSTSGLRGELAAIRQREYELPVGSLLMRPVRLTESSDWRTWDNFNRLVATLNYDTRWAGRRNKLKALRTALRGGYDVVQEFLRTYDIALPPLRHAPVTLHEQGWDGQRCGYFDALEALDHHFLLEELS